MVVLALVFYISIFYKSPHVTQTVLSQKWNRLLDETIYWNSLNDIINKPKKCYVGPTNDQLQWFEGVYVHTHFNYSHIKIQEVTSSQKSIHTQASSLTHSYLREKKYPSVLEGEWEKREKANESKSALNVGLFITKDLSGVFFTACVLSCAETGLLPRTQ